MPNAIKILLVLCSHTITFFLPFHQCLLGKNNSYWNIRILLPPCIHSGMGKKQVIHFILENGKNVPLPFVQAPKKAIYIRLHSTKPKPNKQLFNTSERLNCSQWGATKQSQWHVMAQSPQTLCFSQSKLEYSVSWQSPRIRVLGHSTGCSLTSLRKQNLQDLKYLNPERQIYRDFTPVKHYKLFELFSHVQFCRFQILRFIVLFLKYGQWQKICTKKHPAKFGALSLTFLCRRKTCLVLCAEGSQGTLR